MITEFRSIDPIGIILVIVMRTATVKSVTPIVAENQLLVGHRCRSPLGALHPEWGIITMPPGWRENRTPKKYKMSDYVPPDAPPLALLITGMVPDPSRRWVVAVTRDEEEFQRTFPEYRRLMAAGNRLEASQLLHMPHISLVRTEAR